jgi:nucleotide-binding universal stress UspA family protein
MKKILCPTDFSDVAENAIAYAAKITQATGSELILFNIQSLTELTPLELVRGKALTIETATEQLDLLCRQISIVYKISCYAEVVSSAKSISKTIAQKANGFDLIVMGTNGPDNLYQFFNGSKTYNAMLQTSVPMLLIPEDYAYTPIQRIVYSFDYLRERNLPMAQMKPWVKALGCEIFVLQILEEAYSKKAEEELRELQFIQQTYAADITLHFETIRSSEIAQSINRYISQKQPDALALSTVHRNFIERLFHKSVIKNLSTVSSFPIFIFHQ